MSAPLQEISEIAGPRVESLVAMSRKIMRERGSRAVVIPIRVPGTAGKMMRGGGQLPSTGAQLVGPTFADWLLTTDANLPPL